MTLRAKKLSAWGIGALLFLVSGATWLGCSLENDNIPTITVTPTTFVYQVKADGVLKAVRSTPLTVPLESEGAVKIAWLLEDGARVRSGDVVVRFDPTELENELIDGSVALSTSESQLNKKEVESGAKMSKLAEDEKLARSELQMAQEFQSKDPEIFSRVEIIESEIDEKLAEKRVHHAEDSLKAQRQLAETEVDLLSIERRKAQLKIDHAQKGLAALEVRAPHDGIAIFKRDWRGNELRVGDVAMRGQPLGEIPSLDEMEAEVFVLEADAGGLAVGRPADVVLASNSGAVYHGEIRTVDALPKPRMRRVPLQYFSVTVKLDRTDPSVMKPGQRVRATLTLEQRDQALVVPRQAVFDKKTQRVVYVLRGGDFEAVEVTLGPTSLGRVVIEKGLEAGDVVALRDPTASTVEAEAAADEESDAAPSTPLR
jgi:RND family efflux transporter MFP subunit